MRAGPLVLATLGLAACGSSSTPPSLGAPPSEALTAVNTYRCELREPVSVSRATLRDVPWVTRGPDGPRLVAAFERYDGSGAAQGVVMSAGDDLIERRIAAGAMNTLAWTGAHYLALLGASLRRYDRALAQPAEVRAGVPANACAPTLAEGAERALAVWGRPSSGGACFEAAPWTQAFDASGAPIGDPVALPVPEGATRAATRWIRARWDYARFVVTAELVEGGVWSWVLDPDGRVLGGAHDVLACPRAGCVRVTASAERASDEVDTTAQVIRVEPATRGGPAAFSTTTSAREVRGVVVSGDRVLVLHDTPSRTGCGLAVVDVARRTTVTDFQDESLDCAEGRVRPRARGFVYATLDTVRGAATRALDCTE